MTKNVGRIIFWIVFVVVLIVGFNWTRDHNPEFNAWVVENTPSWLGGPVKAANPEKPEIVGDSVVIDNETGEIVGEVGDIVMLPYAWPSDPAAQTALVKELTGVSVIRIGTEVGAWQLNAKTPGSASQAICPVGFSCTWHLANGEIVFHGGINQSADIVAGTFRALLLEYPEGEFCRNWDGEAAFAVQEKYSIRFQYVDGWPDCTNATVNN